MSTRSHLDSVAEIGVKYLIVCGFVALAGCSGNAQDDLLRGSQVECALDGSQGWSPSCFAETVQVDGRSLLVVHHPDGAFRRLELHPDGTVTAADGADKALSSRANGVVEVRVARDRYRIPAPDGATASAD